jgi:hypothetical protein
MSTTVFANELKLTSVADSALKATAGFWFLVAVIGQWVFLYYILAFYGPSTFTGNFQAWTKNTFLQKGYIAGDTAGNLVFASHALLAAVIAFGGAIQLIPQIRTRALAVHRWNGRLFAVTALGLSVSGLYTLWIHGNRPGIWDRHALTISMNAVLIIVFIVLAWRSAYQGKISTHRRWALRAYLVANAQWFTRVGFMAWFIVGRKLIGIGEGFDGLFFSIWDFGCYLAPLAVLELYLHAKQSKSPSSRFAMAGGLAVLTLLMAVGIFGFYMFTRPLLAAVK